MECLDMLLPRGPFLCTLHPSSRSHSFSFFNNSATTGIYPLSLHDALPISGTTVTVSDAVQLAAAPLVAATTFAHVRSEEHTSELQSRQYLVCRLLLEKKNLPTQPEYPRVTSFPVLSITKRWCLMLRPPANR